MKHKDDYNFCSADTCMVFWPQVQAGGSRWYKIEGKLGTGVYGQVYVGRHVSGANLSERTEHGVVKVYASFQHQVIGCICYLEILKVSFFGYLNT